MWQEVSLSVFLQTYRVGVELGLEQMEYRIKSLGYRTDFIFNKLDGSLEDRGDYIVATTKSNPHYFWGNLLLFKRPPRKGDLEIWRKLFQKEFSHLNVFHMTFAWDSPTGEVGECDDFIANGFELDKAVVLTATHVKPPRKYNQAVEVREIDLEAFMERCIEIQVACANEHLAKETWREFYKTSMANYLNLIRDGHGKWFGAFLEGELVGSLGLFKDREVGRFQIVSTHPDFQRKGVCSTLVYESAKNALNDMEINELVMVADEEYHAAKIYESVGFVPTQKQAGPCWWDRERHK